MPMLSEGYVHAVRLFRRDAGTAFPAAAILSVGLGANLAIFAVAYAVLLRPLPVHEQDRLVVMWEHSAGQATSVWEVSFRDFRDWQSQNSSFSGLAATGSSGAPPQATTNRSERRTAMTSSAVAQHVPEDGGPATAGKWYRLRVLAAFAARQSAPADSGRTELPTE